MGQPTIAQLLQELPEEGTGLFIDLLMLLSRNLTIGYALTNIAVCVLY